MQTLSTRFPSLLLRGKELARASILSADNYSRQIHSKQNENLTNRKDIFYKSVLNEHGHKNVYFNNYRIAATSLGSLKNRKRINSANEAKQFVNSLTPNERTFIKDELIIDEKDNSIKESTVVVTPTFSQLFMGKPNIDYMKLYKNSLK